MYSWNTISTRLKTEDLLQKLGEWLKMYHEEASPGLKDKILASLHELKFRKAIDQQNYMEILNDMDNYYNNNYG